MGFVGLGALALAAPLSACNESRAPFAIEIVGANGQSPVAGVTSGRLSVLIAQEGQPTRDQGVDLVDGSFQLDVTIANYVLPTRLGVELLRDGVPAYGATPTFAPFFLPFVRIPVVPQGSCQTVGTQRLTTPRSGAALLLEQTHLLVIGGLDASASPATSLERFTPQLLTAAEGSLPTLSLEPAVGRARAASLASTSYVVVVSAARNIVIDLESTATAPELLTGVHAGVGERSALLSLGGEGIAIVGGSSGSGGAASVSWVALDRAVTTTTLPSTRRDAAVSMWGSASGVLVAGGNEAGASTFLFVPAASASRESVVSFGVDDVPARVLRGGALVRSPDGAAALYVGALDEAGNVVPQTYLVTGCPSACRVVEGPLWPRARSGFAMAQTASGAWLLGGRDASGPVAHVERVRWSGATPSFVETSLVSAREDAAATPFAGGLVLIAGGRGVDRALDDFELCAPESLEAL